MSYTFEIDWLPLMPGNRWHKGHWSARAKLVETWRGAGCQAGTVYRLPKGMESFHLTVQARHKTNHLTDFDAFAPAAKAIVDGLIDYGLATDDRPEFCKGITFLPSFLDRTKREALIITIAEGEPC